VDYDAIVLAGGRARRLGGIDKAMLEFDGVPLLAIALEAVDGARSVVVVGPRRSGFVDVEWLTENPPDSGPAHALAAGLARGSAPAAVVLGADYPFVRAATIAQLLTAVRGQEAAIATDASGRDQFLLAAYDRTALARALGEVPTTEDASLAAVVRSLKLVRVAVDTAAYDCDTWVDVAMARRQKRRRSDRMLEEWIEEVCGSLAIDSSEVDVDGLLDLSRDVAHGVERRAAPVTTYLAGLAVGAGADPDEVTTKIAELAEKWGS
jgi:molybdopterin-guanine dinucleotide biosynthesis protein A